MALATCGDDDLLRLARDGVEPAFAVLFRRHVEEVHALVTGSPDPDSSTVAVFRDAMRQLDELASTNDVSVALAAIAARHTDTSAAARSGPRALPDERIDRLWHQLAVLWPDGRRHRTVPRAVPWAALVMVLIGLGFALPYVVLSTPEAVSTDELDGLVARPYEPVDDGETDEDVSDTEASETADEVPELPPLPPEDGDDPATGGSSSPDQPASDEASTQDTADPVVHEGADDSVSGDAGDAVAEDDPGEAEVSDDDAGDGSDEDVADGSDDGNDEPADGTPDDALDGPTAEAPGDDSLAEEQPGPTTEQPDDAAPADDETDPVDVGDAVDPAGLPADGGSVGPTRGRGSV